MPEPSTESFAELRLRLPAQLKAALWQRAKDDGHTLSEAVRAALEEYLRGS